MSYLSCSPRSCTLVNMIFMSSQAEFQPISGRIGEVLEKIVAPHLCHTLDLRHLQGSKAFNWRAKLRLPQSAVGTLLDQECFERIQMCDNAVLWPICEQAESGMYAVLAAPCRNMTCSLP